MVNQTTNLLPYQKLVVDSTDANIICNWCRSSGKTYTISKIIEVNNPKNVLIIGSDQSIKNLYYALEKLDSVQYAARYTHTIYVDVLNPQTKETYTTNIYERNYCDDIEYDYIIFDDILPYNTGFKAKQSIAFITCSNRDNWLQRFYPHTKIFTVDYRDVIKDGLIDEKQMSKITSKLSREEFRSSYDIKL